MRSVFVYLKNVDKAKVVVALDKICDQRGALLDGWICLTKGTPVLYVDFYTDLEIEFEPDDWTRLIDSLGCKPSVSVTANVSGRHNGRPEVIAFLKALLDKFEGVVQDDSESIWTMQEVLSGDIKEGRGFFR